MRSRSSIRYRIIAAAILLTGLETPADAFIPLPAGINCYRRAGTPTGIPASWSENKYHDQCSFTFATFKAKRSNDEENDGDEDEDPIFNDSLIYYTPGQMDYARKPHTNGAEVDANMSVLRDRIGIMLVGETLENQIRRPPRKDLGPVEFVQEILSALIEPDDPLPDSGLGVLFHASTRRWRALLRRSVGAPADADSGTIGRSLNHAISRDRNQFGILVGADDAEEYVAAFPGEVVDFHDGFCFVECHLRDAKDDSLLVAMGWQLKRRKLDGSWLIDRIDWQDFRNLYRPGIGREEWLRSVG